MSFVNIKYKKNVKDVQISLLFSKNDPLVAFNFVVIDVRTTCYRIATLKSKHSQTRFQSKDYTAPKKVPNYIELYNYRSQIID